MKYFIMKIKHQTIKKNTYLNRKALIILDPPQFESTAEKKKCRISYPSNITFDEPFKV